MARLALAHDTERQSLSTLSRRLSLKKLPTARVGLCSFGPAMATTTNLPTFTSIDATEGETAINFSCTTSRAATVRWRVRRLSGGVPVESYKYSVVTASGTTHAAQVAGLSRDQTYRAWIMVNATVNPDLPYTLFTEGAVGPDYDTLPADSGGDPPDPNEEP